MSESSASNAPRNAANVKRALIDEGLEIFRTRGDEIILAERPRENLIMDSGVRLKVGEPFEIRVVLRAQKTDFPNEDDGRLFARVRAVAGPLLSAGFVERAQDTTRVSDPGDAERTLDTFYEITYAKSAASLPEAIRELRAAFAYEKRA